MRIVKYFSAWLAAVLVIVLAVNFGFGLLVSIFLGNTLVSSVMGYSKKWVYPLQEITEDQEKNPNANFIMLRTLFSNQTLVSEPEADKKFPYFKMWVDQSTVILNQEGRHPFSSGYFATVYQDFGNWEDYIVHAVGLADIGELSQKEGAAAVFDALASKPNAVIRLDAYTLENGKVTPVEMTLLDPNGSELLVSDFPAEGDIIREDNCYIKNEEDGLNDGYSVYRQLSRIYEGEKSSDRIAEEYADQVTPGAPDYEEDHLRFGAGCITRIYISAINGNTGIYAFQLHYPTALLIYSVALGLIMTVILLVLFFKRR